MDGENGNYMSKEKRKKKIVTYHKKNYEISQSFREEIKKGDISIAPSVIMSKIIEH